MPETATRPRRRAAGGGQQTGRMAQTASISVRIGAQDIGKISVPAGLTIAKVTGHLPEIPSYLDLVVIDDDFASPVKLSSRARVRDGMSLFFTAMKKIEITNEKGTRTLRTVRRPVMGYPLAGVPQVLNRTGSSVLNSTLVVDDARVSTEELGERVVEQEQRLKAPDP